jgi:4-hydroxybenzoate polyprenyltransferase
MTNRWWTYQRERFPVMAHSPLILAFSLSAVSFSSLLRGASSLPGWKPCAVAFATSFLIFLQLRLADEFKDFEEDSQFRPYRPVPRGLIRLRELGWLWAGCMAIQLALAWWLTPRLMFLLVATWVYLGLMSKEFFVKRWLKERPTLYMVSHMAIMPLVDLYATACDWAPLGNARPPRGLLWFLSVSLFNGMVVEIGRKIRSPRDEENGVETYSFLWGRARAVAVWLAIMIVTGSLAVMAARRIAFQEPTAIGLGVWITLAVVLGMVFLKQQKTGQGKYLESMAGVWSLVLYLTLGIIPLTLRAWRGQ